MGITATCTSYFDYCKWSLVIIFLDSIVSICNNINYVNAYVDCVRMRLSIRMRPTINDVAKKPEYQ